MKKIKRTIAIIMLLIIIVCMFPIYSSAAYDYIFPVNNGGKIAYVYGNSASYGGWHGGIDIHSTGDDYIYAAYDGVVGATANSCTHVSCGYKCAHYNTYGNYIRVNQDDGTKAYYGHLLKDSLLVSIGTRVTKGQPIAKMGSSGYSTGKHLHFEVRSGDTKINVNPASSGGSISYSYAGYGNIGSNPPPPAYSSVGAGDYNIINKASGKYLNAFANAGAAKSTTNICASNADNSAEQKFKLEALGSNKYLIRSLSNSNLYCVDIKTSSTNPGSGTNVYLYSNTSFASKHWYFEDVGGGYYVIRSVLNSNLVLAAVSYEARANVCIQNYTGSDLQKWQLVSLNSAPPVAPPPTTNASTVRESNFNIISKSSGNYLNAFANPGQATSSKVSTGTGTNVCVSNSDGTMEQVWKLEKYNGSNQYYIRSCSNTGYYCVNAWSPQNYVADGADVRLYNYNTTSSKHWTFEDAGGGYYVIRNVMNSNLVLTSDGNDNRANVCVRSYTGGDNQKWKLVDLINKEKPAVSTYYVDLNGFWNGAEQGTIDGVGTADVYINGTLVADDVTDFYNAYPAGTTYEFKDIKGTNGYSYIGLYAGSLTGTLSNAKLRGVLSFEKVDNFTTASLDTDKVYSLANKSAGTYLNCFAGDSKVTVKTNVCASNSDNSNEQKFKIQSIGDGKYLIRSLSNANLYCVDVHTPANVAEDGANVWMYHDTDYASKHWYFESIGNGYYVIRNALNTNLVLTAVSKEHRANVVVKSYTGDDLQKWKLCDATASSGTGESASQSENIQKLNTVMRNWINVSVPYSLNVNTSKTEIVDFNNPPATMDCSSFTSSLYLTVFDVNIGRNTREQRKRGAPVGIDKAKNKDYSDLMIGDLILFDWNGDTVPNHVGIYSGNGKFIHMTTGNAVVEASLNDNSRYASILTIRRIIQQDGSLWPMVYISQGDSDELVGASASVAIINGDVLFEFDNDEQCINNILSGTLYGDILLNTEYDKLVVCNKTGGELLELTREYVTSEEYSADEMAVLSGTIAKFYDKDGNLMFVGECKLEGMTDDTLYGDAFVDELVDELDAMQLLNFVNGWSGVDIDVYAADAYKDGIIDELDVMNILNYANGWDIVLG